MNQVLVMMLDPDGIPRAWGLAPERGKALREAEAQLVSYRKAKRKEGDPLAFADYKVKTETVEVG